MKLSKRYLILVSTALVVLLAGVFLLAGKVYAQEQPRPLFENEKIILQQKEVVEQKEGILKNAATEILQLEDKKISLSSDIDNMNKDIDGLQQKLVDKKAKAEAEKKRLAQIRNMFVRVSSYAGDSRGNTYTAGNCTWYAKSRRADIPNNLGNANTWYVRAQAQGWNVGLTPKKGAIATTTAGLAGHVAYVEGVSLDGQYVTISEMNRNGLYSMNTRTAYYTEFKYIYELE